MAPTEHTIETGSGRLHARRWTPAEGRSAAPAIVLFHDSLGCVDLWRDFPGELATATALTVVAYDRLGFGRSDPHPGRLARGFVEDEAASGVAPLMAALRLARIVPIGHSVGGGMALATAARRPQDCAAVVTIAAQAFVEDRTLAGIRAAQTAFEQPGQLERLARYHGAKARWVLDAWIGTWLAADFADWSLDPVLARVTCPVLALHGDGDEYGSTVHPRRIAAGVTGPARALVLEGVGHVPQREQPERVRDEIARFLADALASP